MIEYTTATMPNSVRSYRGNTAGFRNDESPNKIGTSSKDSNNYAGKDHVKGSLEVGLMEFFVGDKRISYIVGGCKYL